MPTALRFQLQYVAASDAGIFQPDILESRKVWPGWGGGRGFVGRRLRENRMERGAGPSLRGSGRATRFEMPVTLVTLLLVGPLSRQRILSKSLCSPAPSRHLLSVHRALAR
jgi:hypothetical protein